MPCIVAFLELILVDYAYHSLVAELAVVLSFAGSYLAFTFYLKKVNGYYPYPFMENVCLYKFTFICISFYVITDEIV